MALGHVVFTRPQSVNMILILIDVNAAARTAIGTYTIACSQPPHPLLVQKVLAAQCTHGTQVDHVARQLVVARAARKYVYLRVATTIDNLQFRGATDFARESDTSRAHDAAVGEQRDVFADIVFILLDELWLLQASM
jgi:hypothetical protein